MKKRNLLFIIFLSSSIISNCQSTPTKLIYDFSCMEDDIFSSFINIGANIENEILSTYGENISVNEEMVYGDSALIAFKNEYSFILEGNQNIRIQSIFQKLTLKIKSPKGYKYTLYLIESEDINAFTIGAKIYITTKMLSFCASDDEIACILGHEIAHNELGHIKDGISRVKTARNFGVIGDVSASMASLISTSFNQKNEVHSDFIGIDIAIAAGYDGCASSRLWNRMKSTENSSSGIDVFFNTHPYSSKREVCAKRHIEVNYSQSCE